MSRARHKRAMGGKATVYAGEGSNVLKEAEERKRGGRIEHMEGEGEKAKERHDRPKRAKGGRVKGEGVGANLTPLSTAAKIKEVTKSEQPVGANED